MFPVLVRLLLVFGISHVWSTTENTDDSDEVVQSGVNQFVTALSTSPTDGSKAVIDSTTLAGVVSLVACTVISGLHCSVSAVDLSQTTANSAALLTEYFKDTRASTMLDQRLKELYQEKLKPIIVKNSRFPEKPELKFNDIPHQEDYETEAEYIRLSATSIIPNSDFLNYGEGLQPERIINQQWVSIFSHYTHKVSAASQASRNDETKYELPKLFSTDKWAYMLSQSVGRMTIQTAATLKTAGKEQKVILEVSGDLSPGKEATIRRRSVRGWWQKKAEAYNKDVATKDHAPLTTPDLTNSLLDNGDFTQHALEAWISLHPIIERTGSLVTYLDPRLSKWEILQHALRIIRAGIALKAESFHLCSLNGESFIPDDNTDKLYIDDFSMAVKELNEYPDFLPKDQSKWKSTPCFTMLPYNENVNLQMNPNTGKMQFRQKYTPPNEDEFAILWMVFQILEAQTREKVDIFASDSFRKRIFDPESSCVGMYFGTNVMKYLSQKEYPVTACLKNYKEETQLKHAPLCSAKNQLETLRMLEHIVMEASKGVAPSLKPKNPLNQSLKRKNPPVTLHDPSGAQGGESSVEMRVKGASKSSTRPVSRYPTLKPPPLSPKPIVNLEGSEELAEKLKRLSIKPKGIPPPVAPRPKMSGPAVPPKPPSKRLIETSRFVTRALPHLRAIR